MKTSKYFCFYSSYDKNMFINNFNNNVQSIFLYLKYKVFDSINVILFLLFLTGAFIPIDIESIITGLTICLNPFSFHEQKLNGGYNFVSSYFDFGLENSNLEKFGIKSDSTIVNMTSFLLSIIIIWILHLWIHYYIILYIYCISSVFLAQKLLS